MAADDLETQGSKASSTMVLTCIAWNILVSAPEGLKPIFKVSLYTVAIENILFIRRHIQDDNF